VKARKERRWKLCVVVSLKVKKEVKSGNHRIDGRKKVKRAHYSPFLIPIFISKVLCSMSFLLPPSTLLLLTLMATAFSTLVDLPHQVKDYQYCISNNLYDINMIYVINTMDSFGGILIGRSEIEITCGEIQMTTDCQGIPTPSQTSNDLCEMASCPIPEQESSHIAFHSDTPLPNVSCDIRLEIMAGNWSYDLMTCQNLTTVSCVEFTLGES
jgi:hypothetical protein